MIDRRRFLALAGSVAAPSLPLRANPFPGPIRLGVKYQMIQPPSLSVGEKFALLDALGFSGTEVRTDEPLDLDEVRRSIEDTGVVVHGIVNAGNPEIRPALERAGELGASSVLVFAQEDRELGWRENFRTWRGRVEKALPLAEQLEIPICVENVRATFLKTAEGMVEFIDSFDSPLVRSYFDLGNTITWTEQPAEHWAEVLGKRVEKLDIKDRGHPEFGDAKLAREGAEGTNGGEVHWARVRKILAANGFSGWASAEVAGGGRDRLAGIHGWMRDVLALDD